MNTFDVILSMGACCDCEDCLLYSCSGPDFPYMICCDVCFEMYNLALDMILDGLY